jgi:predicted Na+-dependent transporter
MTLFLELTGNVLLFALVFGMSATVDINCMKQQVRNKNAILLGIFCQFILLPFLGFAIVNILNLDAALGITLLVVTSSPGGSYSNWCVDGCYLIAFFDRCFFAYILNSCVFQVVFHVQR